MQVLKYRGTVRYVSRHRQKSNRTIAAFALIGSFVMGIVCTFAPPFAQIAVLGSYISILCGLVFSALEKRTLHEQFFDRIASQLGMAKEIWRDQQLSEKHEQIVAGIVKALRIENPLFRKLALAQISSFARQCEALGRGIVEFYDTESWRLAYEEILRSEEVKHYRSVALVTAAGYWQDVPGQQSLELNYELQEKKNLSVERIVILADHLWPQSQKIPSESIADWIFEQHNHGIWVELVRVSQLELESDLLADTGLYGDTAYGVQTLDNKSRTMQFSLSFNDNDVEQGVQKWKRLKMYSTSVRKLLDQ